MILSYDDLTPAALEAELGHLARKIGVGDLSEAFRFPRFFQIETTRLCNARCPFCAIDKWDKSTPFMADGLWEKILAELLEHKDWIRFVDIQRAGEPLLDKQIYTRIKQLKDGGIRHVGLATNASALTAVNARRLLEAGIDEVMISIDSVVKEQYEKLRVGLDYDRVLENIQGYFRIRQEIGSQSKIRVRAVCVFDPDQESEEVRRWEEFWAPLKQPQDRIYMKRAHSWGNQVELKGTPSPEAPVLHPCIIPWSTMHITAMGRIALCPHDYDGKADLGNLNTQTIAEVWRAEKIQQVRDLHAAGKRSDISFCRGCRTFDEDFSLERDKTNWRTGQSPA